jgi:hypothetical protein
LIGVPHSRCSIRNDTSDCRAAGLVARAIPTGMLTKPKLMDPFQIVRIGAAYSIVVGCREFAERGAIPPPKASLAMPPGGCGGLAGAAV